MRVLPELHRSTSWASLDSDPAVACSRWYSFGFTKWCDCWGQWKPLTRVPPMKTIHNTYVSPYIVLMVHANWSAAEFASDPNGPNGLHFRHWPVPLHLTAPNNVPPYYLPKKCKMLHLLPPNVLPSIWKWGCTGNDYVAKDWHGTGDDHGAAVDGSMRR